MTQARTPESDLEQTALYRWHFDEFEFDEARLELKASGNRVELEPKPLRLLSALLRRNGQVVSKQELFQEVWRDRVTVEHVLATAISKLRKAMGTSGDTRIVTVHREGYRFTGKVERIDTGHRMATSTLQLQAGQPVPGRPHLRLTALLGSSRSSEVWLCDHGKTGQTLVYKFALDRDALSGLKRETTVSRLLRDALGQRDDFIQVTDWNFASEPYFLETEYGGANLVEWSESHDVVAGWTSAQRIGFFLQIADAVAAAHGIGILHKDIKPGNVLVKAAAAGNWQVALTDFGSSRLLEPERLEELGIAELGFTLTADTGSFSSGTPLYLAPELIAKQPPTVRSDVYALGILLFQIVIGDLRKPMASGWERLIDDPLLRADIAAATDGDPAQRLGSVSELISRLRQLEQRRSERRDLEEAQQRAHTAQRRLDVALARRPWAIATLAVLAAGLAISLWLYHRAESAHQRALVQADRAETVNAFLQELLTSADPGSFASGYEITLREALERVSGGIEKRFSASPESEIPIRSTIAQVYDSLGDNAAVLQHRQRAADLATQVHGPRSNGSVLSRYRLAEALSVASRYPDAGQLLTETDADRRETSDPGHALALAAATAWGRHHVLQIQGEQAVPHLEEALRLQHLIDPEDLPALYMLNINLAQARVYLGRSDEALALLRSLHAAPFDAADISTSRRALGTLLLGTTLLHVGQLAEAISTLETAVAAIDATYGVGTRHAIMARSTLAAAHGADGGFAIAAPLLLEARQAACALYGQAHQHCLSLQVNEGIVLLQNGQPGDAEARLASARPALLELLGDESPVIHVIDFYRASGLLELRRSEEAATLADRLDPDKLMAGIPAAGWPERVQALKAVVMIQQGRTDEGIGILSPIVALLEDSGTQEWIIAPMRRHLTGHQAP